MHNLPCEKQKELKEELSKFKIQFNIQKEMRQNLEVNIENIVLNFKRFYDEADSARRIVTLKLKEIENKES